MQGREVRYPPGKDDLATLRVGGNLAYVGCIAGVPECQLPEYAKFRNFEVVDRCTFLS